MLFFRKVSKNDKGFTLIELILTVVILALVTAPFLSSFVTAANTNAKSKRIQEANELSQYVIEQFKASPVKYLESEYGLTEKKDATGNFESYITTVNGGGSGLLSKYSGNYTAEITMTPIATAKLDINDKITPVVDEVSQEVCAFLSKTICKKDSNHSNVNIRRCVTVDVKYDAGTTPTDDSDDVFVVNLLVEYKDIGGTVVDFFRIDEFKKIKKYEKISNPDGTTTTLANIPVVYMTYKVFNGNDEIILNNNLKAENLKYKQISGEPEYKLKAYMVMQQKKADGLDASLNAEYVKIKEDGQINAKSVLYYNGDSTHTPQSTLNNTIINTNIVKAESTAAEAYFNGVVETEDIDSMYELEVVVKYAGKEISTYTATKEAAN